MYSEFLITCIQRGLTVISFQGVPSLDYYMVEIFEASHMKFNPAWATIIVRMAEILSEIIEQESIL